MSTTTGIRLTKRQRHLTEIGGDPWNDEEWLTLSKRAGTLDLAKLRMRAYVGDKPALSACGCTCDTRPNQWNRHQGCDLDGPWRREAGRPLSRMFPTVPTFDYALDFVELAVKLGGKSTSVRTLVPCDCTSVIDGYGCTDCQNNGFTGGERSSYTPWWHALPTMVSSAIAQACWIERGGTDTDRTHSTICHCCAPKRTIRAATAWLTDPSDDNLVHWTAEIASAHAVVAAAPWVPQPFWDLRHPAGRWHSPTGCNIFADVTVTQFAILTPKRIHDLIRTTTLAAVR